MNAFEMAQSAYSNTAAPIRTHRGTEYEAFARITHRLRASSSNKSKDYSSFVRALTENRRLWTLLASDVADSSNALPKELRAQIFFLAEFTLAHTSKVLSKKADVEPLIDINTAMMRGLHRGEQK